ncbi:hypothetical protein EV421DRAFT_186525 [Armillaria borealis]|uniref:Uncharacterized protein n=1 Tax=Armillaria borealis TaxID=47425 RepID=A0AA39JSS4_9AGAR|nr:hypothetical protein EV421DRAFT_186525 [Armillaria borealis]
MFKCRQLSKLSKLNGKSSVVFRGCKPGALTGAFPIPNRFAVRLDPKHPALRVNLKDLPIVSQPFLAIKAIPFGILTKPENAVTFERPVELWESRVARLKDSPLEKTDASRISLPVHLLMPKKTVHKKKYLRVIIARKIKTAIALIMSRDLDIGSKGKLVLNDREDCDKLIVDGWSYVISPQLEIYRMPFEDLVKGLRKSLLQISNGIRQLEQQWSAKGKHVYSRREEARFTRARSRNPTLAEMRAKMREHEEKRRRDAAVETELQLDDLSPERFRMTNPFLLVNLCCQALSILCLETIPNVIPSTNLDDAIYQGTPYHQPLTILTVKMGKLRLGFSNRTDPRRCGQIIYQKYQLR